jgi:hypothetical protein
MLMHKNIAFSRHEGLRRISRRSRSHGWSFVFFSQKRNDLPT